MRYLILFLVLSICFSCTSISKLKPQKQKDRESVQKHDKTKKKVPAPLKKAYKYYYLMFIAMSCIGVLMLTLGIKGLNKDLIIGGGSLLGLGILGPILIYLALLALKVILWTLGIAFSLCIAYFVYHMYATRTKGESHIKELVHFFDDHKGVPWNEETAEQARESQSTELQDKIKKIKGK